MKVKKVCIAIGSERPLTMWFIKNIRTVLTPKSTMPSKIGTFGPVMCPKCSIKSLPNSMPNRKKSNLSINQNPN